MGEEVITSKKLCDDQIGFRKADELAIGSMYTDINWGVFIYTGGRKVVFVWTKNGSGLGIQFEITNTAGPFLPFRGTVEITGDGR